MLKADLVPNFGCTLPDPLKSGAIHIRPDQGFAQIPLRNLVLNTQDFTPITRSTRSAANAETVASASAVKPSEPTETRNWHQHPPGSYQQLISRMLRDSFSLQTRDGCAGEGFYVLRPLSLDEASVKAVHDAILAAGEARKPSLVRLNFTVLLPEDKVHYIISSVAHVARDAGECRDSYNLIAQRAIFSSKA